MRWFAKNIRTFLLALVLALAVWISAVTAEDPDDMRTLSSIPLEVIGMDSSLIITSELPPTVEVTLRAPSSIWEQLSAQDNPVQATLDLSGISAGTHALDIEIRLLIRPVQIVFANPTTVTVTLEPLATETLPVELFLSGEPAIGYEAGEAVLDLQNITISGPKSIVDQAARARVLVSLDEVRESLDQSLAVQIVDAQNNRLNGISVTPDFIHVNIPVSLLGGFRDIAVKVIVQGQQAAGYRLENISVFPQVITVFSSDSELVNTIPGVVETQPLDIQDAENNISTRLALILPENITVVGAKTVQVTVAISPIQTSLTLSNQQIRVLGLSEGLAAQVLPQTVDVIISGPLPVLDTLTPQDIIVSVDVTGLTLGTYQLTPKWEVLVGNVLVESILPSTIEVVISIPATPTATPIAITPQP